MTTWGSRNLRLSRVSSSLLCAVFLFILIGLPTALHAAGGKETTLKIGCLLSLSGWYSGFDAVEDRDVKIVAQMINDKGGVHIKGEKHKLHLVVEDIKSTPDGATAAAAKLVYDHGVKFVVGPGAFFTMGAAPILERNRVMHVSGWISLHPGELDASTPYGFIGHCGNPGMVMAEAKAMQQEFPHVKKIVVLTPDEGGRTRAIDIDKQLLEKTGYTVLEIIRFPNEMVDVSPIVTKINAMKAADAIFNISGAPQFIANAVRELRQTGNTKPIACFIGSDDILKIITPKEAGNLISLGTVANNPNNTPLIKEVSRRAGGAPPIYLMTPNSLYILAQVIEAANSTDPAVVKAKWESMDKVETLYGEGVMCGDSTYGIKKHAVGHPFPYHLIKDGTLRDYKWIPTQVIP